jgi:protein SCO1/2
MSARDLLAGAAAACFVAVSWAAAAHGPDPTRGVAFEPRVGTQLPMGLPFTDEGGRDLPLGRALGGKPAVLVLGYLACKDLCPTTLAGVTQALDASGLAPGRDYRALFVSIDPRETAAELRRERDARIPADFRSAWTFLRGDASSVARLAAAEGFRYRYEPGRDAFAHAAGLVVVTPGGVVSGDFPGVRFDPHALGAALRKAGEGGVSAPASPLLLLCYHFDPLTGRYTLAILDWLRAAIAAFLAGAAFWAWRLRARKAAPR